jgi:hypothetical protein
MANQKLTDLVAHTNAHPDDYLLVVDNHDLSGYPTSKKITIDEVYKSVLQLFMFTWCPYCGQKNVQQRESCWACGGRLHDV